MAILKLVAQGDVVDRRPLDSMLGLGARRVYKARGEGRDGAGALIVRLREKFSCTR